MKRVIVEVEIPLQIKRGDYAYCAGWRAVLCARGIRAFVPDLPKPRPDEIHLRLTLASSLIEQPSCAVLIEHNGVFNAAFNNDDAPKAKINGGRYRAVYHGLVRACVESFGDEPVYAELVW